MEPYPADGEPKVLVGYLKRAMRLDHRSDAVRMKELLDRKGVRLSQKTYGWYKGYMSKK